jgi:hypothetical protein
MVEPLQAREIRLLRLLVLPELPNVRSQRFKPGRLVSAAYQVRAAAPDLILPPGSQIGEGKEREANLLKTDCKVVEVIRDRRRIIRQLSVYHERHRVRFTLFSFNLRALN